VLLSGSQDKTASVFDTRSPTAVNTFMVGADVETAKWNPFQQHFFMVGTEDGIVQCFDVRNTSQSVFTLQAHGKSITSMDLSTLVPNCLVTASLDKDVKLWNISENRPSHIVTRNLEVGKVFSVSFTLDPENPFLVSVGGTTEDVTIWDAATHKQVKDTFIPFLQKLHSSKKED
jgi:periodic tryptophan protein 1